MTRRPAHLAARVAPATEVVRGDVADPADAPAGPRRRRHRLLPGALAWPRARTIEEADRAGPRPSGRRPARRACGGSSTSAGSARRRAVGPPREPPGGRAGAGGASGVPTLELRASIVIGSGSTSFEMIRALVERLPVMVTPRWVGTRRPSRSRSRTCSTTWPRRLDLDLGGEPGRRDRRRRPRLLRRPHARVRPPARPAPADDPGAGALAPRSRACGSGSSRPSTRASGGS